MNVLIESQYFPPIAYFAEIASYKRLIINDKELFNKQSYRNRCTILGANGTLDLIAPVSHSSSRKMNKLELNYTDRWCTVHQRSIESAYRRSPYFEYFGEEILSILENKPQKLIDLNIAILSTVFKILEIETDILPASQLSDFEIENCIDLSNQIHPKKNYKNKEIRSYQQVFGKDFIPNLSILDPLFCIGKETINWIKS